MVKGGLIILTPPLDPNLENYGTWKQGHKSPKYNIKDIILLNIAEEIGENLMGTPPIKISRNQEIQVKNLQNLLLQFAAVLQYSGSSMQQHPEYVHVNL